MKLASAERELAKMDGLKAEIEKLKGQVSDRDKKIEAAWLTDDKLVVLNVLNVWVDWLISKHFS